MRTITTGVLLSCLPALAGCLLAVGAAVGGGGILVTAEDTVEVIVERGMYSVYEVALTEVRRRGTTQNENREFYRFEGSVGNSDVWVEISPEESHSTRLRVRARKIGQTMPDLDLARDLSTAIVETLYDTTPPPKG